MTNRQYLIDNNVTFDNAIKLYDSYCNEIGAEVNFMKWLEMEFMIKPSFRKNDIFVMMDNGRFEMDVITCVNYDKQIYNYAVLDDQVKFMTFYTDVIPKTNSFITFIHEPLMKKVGTLEDAVRK